MVPIASQLKAAVWPSKLPYSSTMPNTSAIEYNVPIHTQKQASNHKYLILCSSLESEIELMLYIYS